VAVIKPQTWAEADEIATRTLAQLVYPPVRVAGATCVTCTEPVPTGDQRCNGCRAHVASSWRDYLADYVVPLTYASDSETPQIRRFLHQYKNGFTESERVSAYSPLTFLFWQFVYRHYECLNAVAGGQIDGVLVVPSGKVGSRPDGHPIEQFARYFPESWQRIDAKRISDSTSRLINPDSLALGTGHEIAGRRIVVFDDTWTTGAAVQTASVALKRAGAAAVVIVVLGRWANSSWAPVREFFGARPRGSHAADSCPVTGGACGGWPR